MTLLTMMSLCARLILLLACVQMFRRCERLENRIEDVCNDMATALQAESDQQAAELLKKARNRFLEAA